MDKRSGLTAGARLPFEGMECHVESEIGRGSNAIVYRGWYEDRHHAGERHEVLIKELFPFHPKGAIYRDEAGEITCTPEGGAAFETHRRSFEAGNAAHLALLRRSPDEIGANLNTYELNNTLYTVLGFSGGRTLKAEAQGPATRLRPLVERMLKLLDALDTFHESGLLHLDIAPDNILLIGSGQRERVLLIDYNSCLRVEDAARGKSVVSSVKPGYTAPEIRARRLRDLCPATDLYGITAVFFDMLTGEPLTTFQMTRSAPPEVSDCPCLADAPETVRSWVRHILRRGLCALPSRRYARVAEMRADMRELLDRIDGVGITHWALWEAGWRNVDRKLRENPSLSFIRDAGALYPSNAEGDDGAASMEDRVAELLSPEGESALLIAGGGMGKTTALLRAAFGQPRKYAPTLPAMAYISLYGWQEGRDDYVLDRVLETLRFKPETHSYADARKTLLELLDQPLRGRDGETPALLLLLDGLNEVAGERKPLIDEILRLSRMKGVRVLAASRVDEAPLPFKKLKLSPLRESDVQAALSEAGLLMPEEPRMRELLRVPLMLSIFILSSRAEQRQLGVRTQDELMRAYFDALREKELASQPENAEARWQIEAATDLVLPAMAREMLRRRRALSDAELLGVVERCYRLLGARLLRRAFPRWVGRSGAIRGDAQNAEEWYGIVVHDILWKRLGLLLRDDQGRYQTSHQVIEEYLIGVDRENARRINRLQWLRRGMIGAAAVLAVALVAMASRSWIRRSIHDAQVAEAVAPYDEAMAEGVFREAMDAFTTAGVQCEDMNALLDCAAETPEFYGEQLELYEEINDPGMFDVEDALALLADMLASGDVMPWSGKPMDGNSCETLLGLPEKMCREYLDFAARLAPLLAGDGAASGDEGASLAIDTMTVLQKNYTASIAGLYLSVIQPHEVGPYAPEEGAARGGANIMLDMPMVGREIQAAEGLSQEELLDQLDALAREREALMAELMGYL